MNDAEFAWFCGLFEGEGNVYCHKNGRYRSLRLYIGMTDEDVVRELHELVGGRFNGPKLDRRSENRKPIYDWTMFGKEARTLALRMAPYMGKRRWAQIHNAIHAYDNRQLLTTEEKSAKKSKWYRDRVWSGKPNRSIKLNPDDVRAIRVKLSDGRTQKEVADEHGVSHALVNNIANGKTWGWLQ